MTHIYDYQGQTITIKAGKKEIYFEVLDISIEGGPIPVKEIFSDQIIDSHTSIGIMLTVRNRGHLLTDKQVAALLNPPLFIKIPDILEGQGRVWTYEDTHICFYFTGGITNINGKVVEAINETIHKLVELRARQTG
ncbi:hypothetical protein [Xanthocytophaga flava]|uniref:hypothetical protein n=1 Tax=Xanthocytophaga flava TaxID=3048013 RepID=UPI0028D70CFF|nr:hypothetical protein [Xanthocytophaga flavus]MDJ1469723.1 hypothetical protein [Xanthocytophaga flavus]